MVKGATAPLQIRLTEPVIFLRGTSTGADFRGRPQAARDGQPAMIRGLLTLRLSKPTRIRNISISLEGKSRTEWPEGIGPRRTDTFEEHTVISETTTYFSATDQTKNKVTRRSRSADPALIAQFDMDSDEEDEKASDDGEGGYFDAPRGRTGRPVLPRSASALPSTHDAHAWHRDGFSRRASPEHSAAPSRQGSQLDLTHLRAAAAAIEPRGPSPAYTPAYTPPLSAVGSRPSSVRGLPAYGEQPPATPDLADTPITENVVWNPPSAATDGGILNRPEAANPPSPAIRWAPAPVPPESQDLELPDAAASHSLHTIDSISSNSEEGHGDLPSSDHHPVSTGHHALPTAPPSPIATPPENPLDAVGQLAPPPAQRRRSSGLSTGNGGSDEPSSAQASRPPSVPPSRPASILLGPGQPTSDLSTPSFHSPSFASGTSSPHASTHHDDHRGRKHHKFSLSAALRSLSHDMHIRSQPSSRASSRNRAETPRTPHFGEENIVSAPMSRSGSAQTGIHSRIAHDITPPGRDHRGGSSRPGSRTASPAGRDEHRGRSRSKMKMFHVGGHRDDSDDEEVHNWKEFRKGTYNYPISFSIPSNAPPSIHAEFGSVVYRLKATVVRVGALTSNLSEEMEVNMIAGPQEDDMEETDNVIVERQWEDQMRYQIALSGKAFPIGGTIPISIRLMPLAKCKIYRITVALEEKTDYFAANKKVARHETPRRFILFAAKNPDQKKERPEPLLPILSESTDAARESPLAEMARTAALNNPREFADFSNPEDDCYASLLDPMGPWHLEKDLQLPDCITRIKFTTKHDQTNISVGHWLKVTIRVERGDDLHVDSKGRRKQFDIIIETPIKILDCRVNTQFNSLPSYDRTFFEQGAVGRGCSMHAKLASAPLAPRAVPIGNDKTPRAPSSSLPQDLPSPNLAATSGHTPHGKHEDHEDTLLERNIVYDRLMSGQETEAGEEPPTYGQAVANAIRSARSASRAASRNPSRSASRAPSRNVSRVALHDEA
ncbi:Arrestin-related trafficking adapter 3 [Vanrija pseudolonga]|uniref:Arrestin-related trafficking adapter 3 n=1 Tax=Vanrija pseudolonga TaxID=143232 RepID=A0AAF0Y4M1_9TREE|nr:Arrestin-related trafficking adapter 3 [Vanrija pseudolonga]